MVLRAIVLRSHTLITWLKITNPCVGLAVTAMEVNWVFVFGEISCFKYNLCPREYRYVLSKLY